MNRRLFLNGIPAAATGTMLGGSADAAPAKAGNTPAGIKNILFLFVDQQRRDCLGSYGNRVVQTPHLDRLARTGVRFTNAYTPAPVCTPARASVQCGLWPHKHKLIFNTGASALRGGMDDPPPPVRFYSEMLKERGWNLAHAGKWHIGTEKNQPSTRGYDPGLPYYPGYGIPNYIYSYRNKRQIHPHYREYLKGFGLDGFNLRTMTREDGTLFCGLQEGPPEASIPSYLANQAIDTIGRFSKEDKPFLVSCHFWGPHAPHCIPEPYYSMYRDADIRPWPNFDCDLSDKPEVIRRYGEYLHTDWFTRERLSDLIGKYYGYISLIDNEIGRIVKALEDVGELDRTLIVYSADHGSSAGSYRLWDKGYGMYDCITGIPMILSHPAIRPSVNDGFVTLLDLMPTFLDAAGIRAPAGLDGASLMPVLRGERNTVRDDFIVTEHHGHHCPFWQRMVRTPQGKYVFNYTAGPEFYDLDADPHETRNIIGSIGSTTRKRYEDMLLSWMRETGDPLSNWAECSVPGGQFPY